MKFFIFGILTLIWSQSAYSVESYNYPQLLNIVNTPTPVKMAELPGKLQYQAIHFKTDEVIIIDFTDLSEELQSGFKTSNIITDAAPPWMEIFFRKLERAVFLKNGVIEFGLSTKSTSMMMYFDKRITLNKSMLKKYSRESKDHRALMKFLITHELAHFLIFNYEITTGKTPSDLITGVTIMGVKPDTTPEETTPILSQFYSKEPNAHAEVDILACVLLKSMNEPVSTELFKIAKKLEPDLISGELEPRRKAVEDCSRREFTLLPLQEVHSKK